MNYQFTLEKYAGKNSRYTCPNCNKAHKFTRYINTQTGQHLADHVGRCDREVKCGYHYKPKQYFEDNPTTTCHAELDYSGHNDFNRSLCLLRNSASRDISTHNARLRIKSAMTKEIDIGHTIQELRTTLTDYDSNHLVQFLAGKLGVQATQKLITKYRIGTHHKWRGSTVFWYINAQGTITAGKIMLYDSHTGKRIKTPQPYISWMHSVQGKEHFDKQPCLFGEHLLQSNLATIGIVESEKTALLAAHHYPQYVWLATGGISNLKVEHINKFNRKVVLYPDVGAEQAWGAQAKFIRHCSVNKMLDHLNYYGDKYNGFDLGDYLLQTG